jgi:CBS domain-containing protein
MLERSTAAVAPDETIVDATRRLLELRLEQLPVADEDGRLVGLIARGGLMRALLQANR